MKIDILWNIVFAFLIASVSFLIADFIVNYHIAITIAQIICFSIATAVLIVTILIDNKGRKTKEAEDLEKMKKIVDEYNKQEKGKK